MAANDSTGQVELSKKILEDINVTIPTRDLQDKLTDL